MINDVIESFKQEYPLVFELVDFNQLVVEIGIQNQHQNFRESKKLKKLLEK